jgi:predicted lipoprotein with Yx(FWY)xxD motif
MRANGRYRSGNSSKGSLHPRGARPRNPARSATGRRSKMKQAFRIPMLGGIAGLFLSAVACGGSDYGSGGGNNAPPPPGAPTMMLATNASLGKYLVDGNGRSLYYYAKDFPAAGSNAAVSNCTGGCLAVWPIFHASSAVVQGINASDVGEITRSDGNKQTTFRGWPLYYFAGDTSAGNVNGEGFDSFRDLPPQPRAATLRRDVVAERLARGQRRAPFQQQQRNSRHRRAEGRPGPQRSSRSRRSHATVRMLQLRVGKPAPAPRARGMVLHQCAVQEIRDGSHPDS